MEKTAKTLSSAEMKTVHGGFSLLTLKHVFGAFAGAFLGLCSISDISAQTVYSVNIVGCVADKTTQLLTAPLTTEQRQALHANNFNQLAPLGQAYYLRSVAYEVGIIARYDGALCSVALAQYLQNASWTGSSVQYSAALLTHKAIVKEAMQQLNVLIAGQIANNSALQQAMDLGATDSFFDIFPEVSIVDDTLNGL